MRIIAGEFRSRKIKMVPSTDTRETSDKVKGAVFNSLISKVKDGMILDFFAGSGSYGLESISRGAKHVLFNDVKQNALITLKNNIASLSVEDKSTVWKLDYTLALKRLKELDYKFDLIFIDPPYIMDVYESIATELLDSINDDGIIILEMDRDRVLNSSLIPNYTVDKEKVYGRKKIIFLIKQ